MNIHANITELVYSTPQINRWQTTVYNVQKKNAIYGIMSAAENFVGRKHLEKYNMYQL